MTAATFALILLAAGYIALRYTPLTRAQTFRSDGHALYFLVIASALAMATYSALILHGLSSVPGVGTSLRPSLERLLRLFGTDESMLELGLVSILSVPIALGCSFIFALPLDPHSTLKAKLLIYLSSFGEVEEFLWITATRQLPVILTMSNGKVYVGTGIHTGSRRENRRWMHLEPLLSGYRDEQHQFFPTVSYSWMHSTGQTVDGPAAKEFDLLLPLDEVRSVQAFDLAIYADTYSESLSVPSYGAETINPPSTKGSLKALRLYFGYIGSVVALPLAFFLCGALVLLPLILVILVLGLAAAAPEDL
jgi:hypothetical protein